MNAGRVKPFIPNYKEIFDNSDTESLISYEKSVLQLQLYFGYCKYLICCSQNNQTLSFWMKMLHLHKREASTQTNASQ